MPAARNTAWAESHMHAFHQCDTALNQAAGCCGRPPLSPFQPTPMIQHHAAWLSPSESVDIGRCDAGGSGSIGAGASGCVGCPVPARQQGDPLPESPPHADTCARDRLAEGCREKRHDCHCPGVRTFAFVILDSFILEFCWSFVLSIGASSCSKQEQKHSLFTSRLMLRTAWQNQFC